MFEAADGFSTTTIKQTELIQAVDITTQKKVFDLTLDEYGPYRYCRHVS